MKRSTLTLSILTALLVSACGGSSSNDEQTKDPTPPKVAPTNPTTPSTGRTPTTGKKEPKKEEAASSSSSDSSDPTPPISSGSAPSGGKPIVIMGEPKEEDQGNGKTDEDQGNGKTDEDKGDGKTDENKDDEKTDDEQKGEEQKMSLEEAQRKLKAAKDKAEKSKNDAAGLKITAQAYKTTATAAKNTARTAQGINVSEDQPIEAVLVEADKKTPTEKAEILKAYNAYLEAQEKANQAQAEADEMDEQSKKDAEAEKDAELQVDLSKVDETWKDKPDVQSVKDIVAVKKEILEATAKETKLQAEKGVLETRKTELVGASPHDAGIKKTLTDEVAKLKTLLATDTNSEETNNAIKKAIAAKEAEIEAIDKEVAQIDTRGRHLDAEKGDATAAKLKAESKKGEVEKYSKNLGVAGDSSFTDNVFTGVQKAEKANGVWTITFDAGENAKGVPVNEANWGTAFPAGGMAGTSYGKFGKIDNVDAAYNEPQNSASSIYGYANNKFYSVGEFVTAETLKKSDAKKQLTFAGTSFLEGKEKQKMVSSVKGYIDFDRKEKGFTGSFDNFYTYDSAGKLTPTTDDALKGSVIFEANITGSSFKPTDNSPAKVYGYFYGDTKVKEAGGLVEHEAFHGSFGGKTTEVQ